MQVSIDPKGKKLIRENLWDTLWIAGPGVLFFLVLRAVAPIHLVPSVSMEPTVDAGSRVLVNRFYDKLDRGDVVVFDSGFRNGLGQREPVIFLKRVVGLPGDTVAIQSGRLVVNGVSVDEPYAALADDFEAIRVPAGHYYVMGDNRTDSYDSRSMGAIQEKSIQGVVSVIVLGDSFLSSPGRSEVFPPL